MSDANGSLKLNCPMDEHWARIKGAMERSEAARHTLQDMTSKVQQLDKLPDIAAEIRNLNRNNTILLIILGALLIINAVANAGVNFKGGALGATAEITHKAQ